jgi:hypothetical protein
MSDPVEQLKRINKEWEGKQISEIDKAIARLDKMNPKTGPGWDVWTEMWTAHIHKSQWSGKKLDTLLDDIETAVNKFQTKQHQDNGKM